MFRECARNHRQKHKVFLALRERARAAPPLPWPDDVVDPLYTREKIFQTTNVHRFATTTHRQSSTTTFSSLSQCSCFSFFSLVACVKVADVCTIFFCCFSCYTTFSTTTVSQETRAFLSIFSPLRSNVFSSFAEKTDGNEKEFL